MSPEARDPLGPDGVTETLELPIGWPAVDLCVNVIDRGEDERHLVCRVWTPHLEEYARWKEGRWPLERSAGKVVDELMDGFTTAGQSPGARISSLLGAGGDLFEAAPEVFRTAFWRLIDARAPLRTILVASQELSFPWELMVPERNDGKPLRGKPMPLGARFNMARWYENRMTLAPPSPLADARVVAPNHAHREPLEKADDERRLVLKYFGGERVDPAFVAEIDQQLTPWNGTLLHFVCHGETPTPMSQVLLLDGEERLVPMQLRGMTGLRETLRTHRPVVFINACEAGRQTLALVGSGGFAKRFIDAGARAVVAPLWSVEDNDAFAVAKRFYARVDRSPQTPFGEILRGIRATAYKTGKDTFAAYCLYGDPLLAAARGRP